MFQDIIEICGKSILTFLICGFVSLPVGLYFFLLGILAPAGFGQVLITIILTLFYISLTIGGFFWVGIFGIGLILMLGSN